MEEKKKNNGCAKAGIGCAVALGVVSLIVVIGARIAINHLQGFMGSAQQLAEISQLDDQVRNQRPYRPEADQALDETQVRRYVDIQRAMLAQLGARVEELEEKYQQLSDERGDRDPSLRDIMGAWQDMVDLIVQAKQAQVDALNEAEMSLEEYTWIRKQVLSTLGHGFAAFDISRLAAEDDEPELPEAPPSDVQQQNRELLEPYMDDADDWLPLSFFGL